MEGLHIVGTGRGQIRGLSSYYLSMTPVRPKEGLLLSPGEQRISHMDRGRLALTTLQPIVKEIHIPTIKQEHPFRALLLYACISEVFYFLFIILSPLPGFHLTSTPLVDAFPWTLFLSHRLVAITGNLLKQYSWISFSLIGMIFIGLFGTYGGVLAKTVQAKNMEEYSHYYLYFILSGAALFGITLLFQPMLLSDDVFTYLFSGRILAIYHANPLNTAPQQFPSDPYLFWTISGRNNPNIYGPLWLCICTLLASISNSPLISLFLFKGLALGAHLINIVLVWLLLSRIAPNRRVTGTLLYAWSPLALIELVASGHNECLLLTLLLTATLCFVLLLEYQPAFRNQRNKPVGTRFAFLATPWFWRTCTLLLLGLAIGTNMVTLWVAPLYIWFEMRQRRIQYALMGFCWRFACILAVEFLLLLPFWRGSDTFFSLTSSVDMAHFVHSPVALLTLPLRFIYHIVFQTVAQALPPSILPDAAADVTVRATATFIFFLIYANLFSQIRHSPRTSAGMRHRPDSDPQMLLPGLDTLLTCCSLAIFWYLILVSGWFWPWYILWVLWLVALRPIDALTRAILLLSWTALFIYAFTGFSRDPLVTYQSALIFGIPLTYLLIVRKKEKQIERIRNSDVRRSQTTQD